MTNKSNQSYKSELIEDIISKNIFYVARTSDDWILLKNGSRTPVFLDTSKFNTYPRLIHSINKYITKMIDEQDILFDRVAGIPYGGLPFSYGLSAMLNVPALSIRKEGKKNYGTAGAVLGEYNKGDSVLLLEDATVTAATAGEFATKLRIWEGLKVNDIITIIDVDKKAKENLGTIGIRLHNVFTWKDLYSHYAEMHKDFQGEARKTADEFVYGK